MIKIKSHKYMISQALWKFYFLKISLNTQLNKVYKLNILSFLLKILIKDLTKLIFKYII